MRRLYRAEAIERARVVRVITAGLENEPDVVFAYLHGSFLADGDFHDVDIGIHFGPSVDQRLLRALDLATRLTRDAGFPVDVSALDDAPPAFRFHVFRTGRLLLARDEEHLADCMERTMREYLDMEPLLRQATIEASGA